MDAIKKIVLGLIVSVTLLFAAGSAPLHAVTTYDFEATVIPGPPYLHVTGFSLKYVDTDGDGLFSLPELVPGSFRSWVDTSVRGVFVNLLGVPGFDTTVSPLTDGADGGFWGAGPMYALGELYLGTFWFPANDWTYSQSPQVPLPPSAFLLGSGLIPLAWLRRRKRQGK